MSEVEQYANLEKRANLVEDGITEERMGPFHVECEFDNAKLATFKVKADIKEKKKAANYSKKEEKRNPNFKLRKIGSATNGSQQSVKLEKNVYLTAAGGNDFKVSAKYKETVVVAPTTVKTRRKLWYQVMKMPCASAAGPHTTGITDSDINSVCEFTEDTFWDEEKKFYIKLKRSNPGSADSIGDLPVQSDSNDGAFISSCKSAWSLKDYKRYAFAIAFVNYIAEPKRERIRDEDVTSEVGGTISLQTDGYLWYGLDPADDASQVWLNSAELYWVPNGSTKSAVLPIPIDPGDVSIDDSSPDYADGGVVDIEIDTSDASKYPVHLAGTGTYLLDIDVKVVAGFSGGYFFGDKALCAIASRSYWDDRDGIEGTAIHEVGHGVGMVPTGEGRLPDSPKKLYGDKPEYLYGAANNDRGHQGPHCGKGVDWDDANEEWTGQPECVMFGSNMTHDGNLKPETFCSDCQKLVRKLDLSEESLATGAFGTVLDEWQP